MIDKIKVSIDTGLERGLIFIRDVTGYSPELELSREIFPEKFRKKSFFPEKYQLYS